jgi:hypothetical protein
MKRFITDGFRRIYSRKYFICPDSTSNDFLAMNVAHLHLEKLLSLSLFILSLFITLAVNPVFATSEQAYSIVCDSDTKLCWQDPQKDAYEESDFGVVTTEAARYCQELELGGYQDWRLPDSDELRKLIAGNPATQPGGECSLTLGGERKETLFRACEGRDAFKGPGANGCYLTSKLTGSCNKSGPPSATQMLEVWASNTPSDDAEGWQAYVSFETASLGYNHKNSAGDVRCVRDSLNSDSENSKIAYTPDNTFIAIEAKEYTKHDACEASDKLEVTIQLPEDMTDTPQKLMVFFYKDEAWRFPPAGPPDGGTDYNVVTNPVFDEQKTTTVLLPACTYYREEVLTGDFRVFVQLMMENRRSPAVRSGDYFWGSTNQIFTLPFNSDAHQGTVKTLELTPWPVVR